MGTRIAAVPARRYAVLGVAALTLMMSGCGGSPNLTATGGATATLTAQDPSTSDSPTSDTPTSDTPTPAPDATGTYTSTDGDTVTVTATFGPPGPAASLLPELGTKCGDIDAATLQRTLVLPITFDVTLTSSLPLQFSLMASPASAMDGDVRTYGTGISGGHDCGFSHSQQGSWALTPNAPQQMTFYWFNTHAITPNKPSGDDTSLRKATLTPIGLTQAGEQIPGKWVGKQVVCPNGTDLALDC